MRKREVSSTLTVYHNGQFWVGVVEHVERDELSVARVVFGAEPSNEEIYAWVLGHWESLQLSEACVPVDSRSERMAGNPKRRAREVAKAMKARGASTASQLALACERERAKGEARSTRRFSHERDERERWELRREKRRRKHRGK